MTQAVMTIMHRKYSGLTEFEEAVRVAAVTLTKVRIGWYRKRARRGEDTAAQVDVLPLVDEQDTPEGPSAASEPRSA